MFVDKWGNSIMNNVGEKFQLKTMLAAVALFALALSMVSAEENKDKPKKASGAYYAARNPFAKKEAQPEPGPTKSAAPANQQSRALGSTVIVLPPVVPQYYGRYYTTPVYGYPRSLGQSRYTQPWGYNGPPIIERGDRYDSALVWDRRSEKLAWKTIPPADMKPYMPEAIRNPNFKASASSSNNRSASTEEHVPTVAFEDKDETEPKLGSWHRRALVSSVDRSTLQLTIITSDGPIVVDARDAVIANRGYRAAFTGIAEGDSVRVWAELSGLNKVKADRVEITSGGSEDTANALKSVTMNGRIIYIDYASFTFKVASDAVELRILADEDSYISLPDASRKAFQHLKIGQSVKVTGIGSLTSGYVAKEIVITSPMTD